MYGAQFADKVVLSYHACQILQTRRGGTICPPVLWYPVRADTQVRPYIFVQQANQERFVSRLSSVHCTELFDLKGGHRDPTKNRRDCGRPPPSGRPACGRRSPVRRSRGPSSCSRAVRTHPRPRILRPHPLVHPITKPTASPKKVSRRFFIIFLKVFGIPKDFEECRLRHSS